MNTALTRLIKVAVRQYRDGNEIFWVNSKCKSGVKFQCNSTVMAQKKPGIEKLERTERVRGATRSSTEYIIHSVSTYSLVVEKINLCTVFSTGVNPESVSENLENLRNGLKRSGSKEEQEIVTRHYRKHNHYKYSKDGKFINRIDYSYTTQGEKKIAISSVSQLRSDNVISRK